VKRGDRGAGRNQDQQQQQRAGQSGHRRVVARPAKQQFGAGVPPGQNRLIQQETLQIVRHLLRRLVTIARIALSGLADDGRQVAWNAGAGLRKGGDVRVPDLPDQLAALLRGKRTPERHQFVQRQTQRVDVAPRVRAAFDRLWGQVAKRADDVTRRRQFAVVDLGQTEIGNPDMAFGSHQQIRRLDVAVQDASLVRVLQGVGNLPPQASHLLPVGAIAVGQRDGLARRLGGNAFRLTSPAQFPCAGRRLLLTGRCRQRYARRGRRQLVRPVPCSGIAIGRMTVCGNRVQTGFRRPRGVAGFLPAQIGQHFVQRPSPDQLHDVEQRPILLAHLQDGDDVGMMQTGGRAGFAEKTRSSVIGDGAIRGERLQGDSAAQR